jgi:hypothetical protein
VWNPDEKQHDDFYADWQKVPDNGLRQRLQEAVGDVHPPCREDAPYRYTLLEGAKGVQLAECALKSWKERRWIDVAPIVV